MEKQVIRSIRKGSCQWNEEDRLQLVPGQVEKKNAQMEYTVEYWEVEDV